MMAHATPVQRKTVGAGVRSFFMLEAGLGLLPVTVYTLSVLPLAISSSWSVIAATLRHGPDPQTWFPVFYFLCVAVGAWALACAWCLILSRCGVRSVIRPLFAVAGLLGGLVVAIALFAVGNARDRWLMAG